MRQRKIRDLRLSLNRESFSLELGPGETVGFSVHPNKHSVTVDFEVEPIDGDEVSLETDTETETQEGCQVQLKLSERFAQMCVAIRGSVGRVRRQLSLHLPVRIIIRYYVQGGDVLFRASSVQGR